jgi:hypothetical protein
MTTRRQICAGVALFLAAIAGMLMTHFVQSAQNARKARAQGCLAQVWLIIEQYRDVNGDYPPRVSEGPSDDVPRSWRVEVLRDNTDFYLSQAMNSYASDQRWDSNLNERCAIRLSDGGYNYFASPEADRSNRTVPRANVLAVVRSEQAEESIVPMEGGGTASDAVILIINEESSVGMFEPVDITHHVLRALISRRGSVFALTADGRFRVLKPGDI